MPEHAIYTATRGGFLISTDPALLDVAEVHSFLTTCYWSPGIPRHIVERAISHSLCFGLYGAADDGPIRPQIGFARVVTDRATFAYLCDVFVLEPFRGQGLGHWLMESVFAHPDLQGLRRFMLMTRDAHGLYERFGFSGLADPTRCMARWNPSVYTTPR